MIYAHTGKVNRGSVRGNPVPGRLCHIIPAFLYGLSIELPDTVLILAFYGNLFDHIA
jgi:hypothetical protein